MHGPTIRPDDASLDGRASPKRGINLPSLIARLQIKGEEALE